MDGHLDADEGVGVEVDGLVDDSLGDRVGDPVGVAGEDVLGDVCVHGGGGLDGAHRVLLSFSGGRTVTVRATGSRSSR